MSLETFFQNAKTYLDILRKCKLAEVERWKEEDLDRAIHWAAHFKKVHERISHRRSLVEKFDRKLKEIAQEMGLGLRFGQATLGVDFFANSLEYLSKVLLENPALPDLLREKIVSHVVKSDEPGLNFAMKMHLEDMKMSTMMVDTLQTMYSKLINCFPNEAVSSPGLVAVDAVCLQEWLLDDTISDTQLVHKRLEEFVQLEDGLEVILHMLLQEPSQTTSSGCAVQQVVLEWILLTLGGALPTDTPSSQTFANKLWLHSSPKLLAMVSGVHFKFFKEHMKFLTSEVGNLVRIDPLMLIKNVQATTGENESEDMIVVDAEKPARTDYTDTSNATTIEMLTEHFVQLALSGEHVKDVCLSLLKSKVLHETEKGPLKSAVATDNPERQLWYTILMTVVKKSSPCDTIET